MGSLTLEYDQLISRHSLQNISERLCLMLYQRELLHNDLGDELAHPRVMLW